MMDETLRARLTTELAALEARIEWWNVSDPFWALSDDELSDYNSLHTILKSEIVERPLPTPPAAP